MKKVLLFLITVLNLTVISILFYTKVAANTQTEESKAVNTGNAVVLELFTSQGCSSCPIADQLLGQYAAAIDDNIIALSFHVDYWNHLGWRDPFSQAQFSQRQRNYARQLNAGTYTPQVLVNGKHETVGGNKKTIDNWISAELASKPVVPVQISMVQQKNDVLEVRCLLPNNIRNDYLCVALVQKTAKTNINRGENEGLKLYNHNIVIDFKTIAIAEDLSKEVLLHFNKNWNREDYLLVAFIQQKENGTISHATKKEII
jgi:hypothetical protein